jgi:hypothetical protein
VKGKAHHLAKGACLATCRDCSLRRHLPTTWELSDELWEGIEPILAREPRTARASSSLPARPYSGNGAYVASSDPTTFLGESID